MLQTVQRPHTYRLMLVAMTVAMTIAASSWAGPRNVSCGQSFTGKAVLTGSCAGTVTINGGTLDLAGFTITSTGLAGVECTGGSCRVRGPGRIIGGGASFGVIGESRVTVTNVDEISGHSGTGVRGGAIGGVSIDDTLIQNNGVGVSGPRIKLTDSQVYGSVNDGVVATDRGVRIKRSQVWDSGRTAVEALLGNTHPRRVKVSESSIMGNAEFGIIARNIKLSDAAVRDNELNPDCQISIPCADLASVRAPVLSKDAICETSMVIPEEFVGQIPIGPAWGVCSED